MHSAYERVESVAEMIARLVCEYEARQAAEGKQVQKSAKSAALPVPLSLHPQPRR